MGSKLGKYKVVVDRSTCIGCGVAPTLCPQVFELGSDNGKNRVIDKFSEELSEERSVGIIPEELLECAEEAASSCPVKAIMVEKLE
jgi:ferredoxin